MLIDAYATQPHFLTHLGAVWQALPPEVRGAVYVDLNINEFAHLGIRLNLPLAKGRPPYRGKPEPLIVASGWETYVAEGRPVVLLEHGAGQSYAGCDSASYSGGVGRDAVALFLCPREEVAQRNRDRYPRARAVAVGAPHLTPITTPPEPELAAVSWHFDAHPIAPEAGCTWPYWQQAALGLAQARPVLGHAHPRIQHKILPWWRENGVEATDDFAEVLRRAAVYAVDNSSTAFEFAAATGRPVVWLNHPSYRREVSHGLRFYECEEMGVAIGDPAHLSDAVELALLDPPHIREARERWVGRIYAAIGPPAAEHAAREVLNLL